jgi:hypothetical protein
VARERAHGTVRGIAAEVPLGIEAGLEVREALLFALELDDAD